MQDAFCNIFQRIKDQYRSHIVEHTAWQAFHMDDSVAGMPTSINRSYISKAKFFCMPQSVLHYYFLAFVQWVSDASMETTVKD